MTTLTPINKKNCKGIFRYFSKKKGGGRKSRKRGED
jgi:hypothetical protein